MGNQEAAEVIERFYNGTATNRDVEDFVNYLLITSSFDQRTKDNPAIFMEAQKIKGGEYLGANQTIVVSVDIINKARQGEISNFYALINAYGHEMTHHSQYLRGDNGGDYCYNVEDLKVFFEAIKAKKELSESDYGELEHALYLSLPYEEEARVGGALFAREVLSKCLTNPFLSKGARSFLSRTLEGAIKYEENYKQREHVYYETLGLVKDLLNEPNKEGNMIEYPKVLDLMKYTKINYTDKAELVSKIWVKLRSFNDLIKDYFDLIGQGGSIVREEIALAFNKEDFPVDKKEKFKKRIMETFLQGDIEERFYEKELKDILSYKDIFIIYESVLRNNIKKAEYGLFENLKENTELDQLRAEVILKVLKNKKSFSMDEMDAWNNEILSVARRIGKRTITDELYENLTMIRKDFTNKINSTKSVK